MPQPVATWNPARGVWETENVALCGHSEPYSATWPTSGTTRNGTAYELPTPAHPTDGSASSSTPGLLPTPTAASRDRTPEEAAQRVVIGWPGGGGPDLASVAALLPTPTVSDTNGPGTHGDGGADLRTAVSLLPT